MMNQLQSLQRERNVRVDYCEFTAQLPKYMMMTCVDDASSDLVQSPRSFRRFAKNIVAGNDMRRNNETNDGTDVELLSRVHRHFQQKKLLDCLTDAKMDVGVKLHLYKNMKEEFEGPSITGLRDEADQLSKEALECNVGTDRFPGENRRETGVQWKKACLKAGTWPDLHEFE